jgi:hypothetical protein
MVLIVTMRLVTHAASLFHNAINPDFIHYMNKLATWNVRIAITIDKKVTQTRMNAAHFQDWDSLAMAAIVTMQGIDSIYAVIKARAPAGEREACIVGIISSPKSTAKTAKAFSF